MDSRYANHPRVRGYGPAEDSRIDAEHTGYTVTADDGTNYQILNTGVFAWTICHGPDLDYATTADGSFAIGFLSAEDAISAVLGEQPTDTTTEQPERASQTAGTADDRDDDTDGM